MTLATSDVCDAFGDRVRVAEPIFRDFGGAGVFAGPIETLRVFEDNALVGEMLDSPGRGRVLVVDGGGSLRTALLGGRLAALAARNGWSGVVVNGGVRDLAELAVTALGVKALAACPRRSGKTGAGERGRAVSFAGVTFTPGHYLWGDADGLVVGERDFQAD